MEKNQIAFDTYSKNYAKQDRAICDSVDGFASIYCKKGSGEILGATIVGGPAGDMISIVTAGMKNKLKLDALGAGVFPYPSYGDIIKALSDQFNRTKLTSTSKAFLRGIIKLRS